jgi:MFS family permease
VSWRSRLGPLAERDFRLLFLGRTVTFFGSALAPVALAFAVLDLTGSATDLGLVTASFLLPQIVFILIGGIWADRLPRHHVMVASDALSGAAQAATAALLLAGSAEVWQLAVLAAVRGTASAFFFPASQGIVPQVVSAERLQEANALLRLSRNATSIGGAALGGILVAALGPGWALAIDAATYGLGTLFILALHVPRHLHLPERNFVRELREGWDEFRSRTWLWVIVVQFAFVNACSIGAFTILGAFVADTSLGGPVAWGVILAANGAGLVVGGIVMLRWRPSRPLLVATLGIFPLAAPLLLLAIPASTALIALAAFAAGVGVELFGVLWDTVMQEQIPEEALSRVYSYDMLGSIVFIPLGAALAGPIADQMGVAETLVGAAGITIGATALVLLVPDVRTLRTRQAQGAAAIAAR